MDFWKRLFGGDSGGSGRKAKDRLRIVLIHDRSDISPQLMEQLRQEMIAVLTKYMDIDMNKIELNLDHDDQEVALVANVPVLRIKRGEVDVNVDNSDVYQAPEQQRTTVQVTGRGEDSETIERLRRRKRK